MDARGREHDVVEVAGPRVGDRLVHGQPLVVEGEKALLVARERPVAHRRALPGDRGVDLDQDRERALAQPCPGRVRAQRAAAEREHRRPGRAQRLRDPFLLDDAELRLARCSKMSGIEMSVRASISASTSTNGRPRSSASAAPRVDLPAPMKPTARRAGLARCPSRSAPCTRGRRRRSRRARRRRTSRGRRGRARRRPPPRRRPRAPRPPRRRSARRAPRRARRWRDRPTRAAASASAAASSPRGRRSPRRSRSRPRSRRRGSSRGRSPGARSRRAPASRASRRARSRRRPRRP